MRVFNPYLLHQIFRGALVAALLYFGWWAARYVTPLVYPFILGWLLAYLLNPVINLLQRRAKFPRWLSVTTVILILIALTVTAVTLLVTKVIVELGALAVNLQNNINTWGDKAANFWNSSWFQGVIGQLNNFMKSNNLDLSTNLSSVTGTVADFSSNAVKAIVNSLISIVQSLPNIATVAIIVLLATFFISKDWYLIVMRYTAIIPETARKAVRLISGDLHKALFGFLKAQLILVSLTALAVIIGLLILRVDYAITIGLLIGLCDLMPYLGTGAVMVPWIIYAFFSGNVYLGIGLSVLYGLIVIVRQIMEPKVLASSVGLDPLAALIALFVGLKLFGFIGLILGPVLMVVMTAIYRAHVFHDIVTYIKKGSEANAEVR
ncbi:sporulation integral membrane protein YtvI [Paenibacillus lutrae]|uniref:Sporulation integral membrane protein YtvI n=1 Tax=Paenibacillus lutrae TaxID=2078573 RepID=A0A7X3FJI7_9BACL|nr:sporulation integral membrane protein YtvI [Paenibacillus lutrae]MVP00914.1 sporulation integral membrane protein YtvI [Paenibacillus lutrae]